MIDQDGVTAIKKSFKRWIGTTFPNKNHFLPDEVLNKLSFKDIYWSLLGLEGV